MGESTIVSKQRAVTVIDAATVLSGGSTDKVELTTIGFRTLRLRRAATGDVTIQVYGPKADGSVGEAIASIAAGNNDFPDAIDIRGFASVWVEATDASSAQNTIVVEAFLGT